MPDKSIVSDPVKPTNNKMTGKIKDSKSTLKAIDIIPLVIPKINDNYFVQTPEFRVPAYVADRRGDGIEESK